MGLETTSFTPRFRQRKISLKQNLRISWEKNLPDAVEDVRGDLLGIVETGVDKSEEDERHLQAVLHSASLAGKSADAFIPTPEATKKFPGYHKFYTPGWVQTESYIRSSATVEDAQGVDYCMDSEDLGFMNNVLNKDLRDTKAKCNEDEFESICTLIESVVAEKQPFLSTDVSQLMEYKEAESYLYSKLEERRKNLLNPLDPERLLLESNSPDYAPKLVASPFRDLLASVKQFGSAIFSHWRSRRIALDGRSVKPCVLYESGLSTDDQNPYVTFRHREVRHTRKTRRTDQQNSGRLRKLFGEMRDAQSIFELVLKRERTRLQQIQFDFEIFELRCRTKALKRKLRIDKEPDDLELLVSVSKRARQEEAAKKAREESDRKRRAQLAAEKIEREREKREKRDEVARDAKASSPSTPALPTSGSDNKKTPANITPGSRTPVLEHYTIEQQYKDRANELEEMISIRLQRRKKQDVGWIDAFESGTVPYFDFFSDNSALFNNMRDIPAVENTAGRSSNLDADKINLSDNFWVDGENKSFYDSPEVVQLEGKGTSDDPFMTKFYSSVDFQRQPDKFCVPKHQPSAIVRKRSFDGLYYLDRVIPRNLNPLAQFGDKLQVSPQSEADERLSDRFKFDRDLDIFTPAETWVNDPAKLNGISLRTQNLRFGSILTGKASEMIVEAQTQRRKALSLMFQKMQQQQQQKQQKAALDAQALRAAAHNQNIVNNNNRIQQAQRAQQRQQQRQKAEESASRIQSAEIGERNKQVGKLIPDAGVAGPIASVGGAGNPSTSANYVRSVGSNGSLPSAKPPYSPMPPKAVSSLDAPSNTAVPAPENLPNQLEKSSGQLPAAKIAASNDVDTKTSTTGNDIEAFVAKKAARKDSSLSKSLPSAENDWSANEEKKPTASRGSSTAPTTHVKGSQNGARKLNNQAPEVEASV